MNEVMLNMYAATGKEDYLTAGYAFNHWAWSAPLAVGVDDLAGNHANTHIPEVLGNAVGFELTGNATDEAIVLEFFNTVTQHHSWATGGSNSGEHWGEADRLGFDKTKLSGKLADDGIDNEAQFTYDTMPDRIFVVQKGK